ncbi:MAG: phosphotransferase [Kofleriaceae bacterium]|nr:phosphotransferase [Myxococcales bacterium]MCB9561293.1 phosphotransferase [Kofleriaceae bacterium]
MSAELEACLPVELRGPGTTIAPIAAGLSGAGVYRVEAAGHAYVLKVAPPHERRDGWRVRTDILRAAADAGVAPRVVHVDEARHAVVTELVVDRSLVARFVDPAARATAIGAALRRVHALPIPPGATSKDPREFLGEIWAGLAGFPLPAWIGDAVRRALDEAPPPPDRAPVLSHNDVNPSNLIHDGERVLFLDWDAAGPNDPLYDLAAVAVFLDLDDAASALLIAAHDQAPVATALPARFRYLRRVVAALCGALFLHIARAGGHPGASGGETFELAPTLADVHGGLRTRAVSARTPDGQWQYGQALLKASVQRVG